QVVMARQIAALMTLPGSRIVLAAGVEDGSHVGHASFGPPAPVGLLTNSGGVEAHVGAAAARGVFPPTPVDFTTRLLPTLLLLGQAVADFFGHALHGRFALSQPAHLAQRGLAALAKGRL